MTTSGGPEANNADVTRSTSIGSFAAAHALPVSNALRERLQLHLTDVQVAGFVDKLIAQSFGNVFTRLYDGFQYLTQNVVP